jgi:ankyrin repeat protein
LGFQAIEAAKYLLSLGVDINAKDINGMTALAHAKNRGQPEHIELLKKYGAKE